MKKQYSFLLLCMLSCSFANAQSVGIGTVTPHANAILEVSSGNNLSKGILITGTFDASATVPDLGAGSRLMFYPGKAAFRSGRVNGTEWNNSNVGLHSMAMGYNTIASAQFSTALGNATIATGDYSFAAGYRTAATSLYSIAMGNQTDATGSSSTAMGNSAHSSGSNSTAIGYFTNAIGIYSTALGQETTATGPASIAMGSFTTAGGGASTAMGANTIASGNSSTAMGTETIASGSHSTATGLFTIASGSISTTMGAFTRAKGYASTVIGIYNDSILLTDQTSISNSTPLFIVGNGLSHVNRSNAMVVLKNGNIGIGDNTPTNPLSFPPVLGKKISLYPGSTGDAGFAVQGNQLLIYSDNPNAWVRLGYDQGGIFTNNLDVYGNGNAWLRGTLTQNSDMRLKKNINHIVNALSLLMQLNGYNYYWKNERMDACMQSGVSAQEVKKVFPQLVKADAEGTLSVNYTGLIPYIIEAFKEQQQQIETLKKDNERLLAVEEKIITLENIISKMKNN